MPTSAKFASLRRGALSIFLALVLANFATAQAAPAAKTAAPADWPTAHLASSKDENVQKAYQALNDMIRALGGDAYLNVQNMEAEGRSYAFEHGQPSGMGTLFWSFWQWPDKYRIEVTKQRDIIELFLGDKGYEITYKGTAEQDPKDVDDYLRARNHSLEWIMRKWLPASGTMVLYDGKAMVERNLAEQVTVLAADNDSATISIDAQTRLPVRVAYSWRDPADRQMDDASVIFSNYKLIQGVKTAYSTVRTKNGEMTGQKFMTAVRYNTNMPATLFETKGVPSQAAQPAKPKQ